MNSLMYWDTQILMFINSTISNPLFDLIFPWITDLHKTATFNLIAYPLFAGLFIGKSNFKTGMKVFLGLILCLAVTDFSGNYLLKETIQRPRPGDNPAIHVIQRSPSAGYSFPSNHSANMFALATYSAAFLPGSHVVLFPIAALIAFSRVYNGVHYPLDIFGGGILGAIMALIAIHFVRKQTNKGSPQ